MATAPAENRKQTETSLRAGDILDGRYRVDYLVGRGGMAEVWAGTNERTGKRVALKMLLPSVAVAAGADSLFHREGLASSRVNHPNVVTVFDVIQHEGAACIVMELLTGEPLDVYLARADKLTLSEAYGMLLPAMRGVAAAHAQGVIHRDLKPQNIFICVGPDGRPVTTKVLDFGISLIRAVGTINGPSPPMGTPAYMAPEQIAGSEAIDERADVYGFGVLFFEALTGELPFSGPPGTELYQRIMFDPAPPLGSLRTDLPPGVLRLVDVALAKDPRDRHAGLDVMIGLLEAELALATPWPGALGPITAGPVSMAADLTPRATPSPRVGPSDERQSTQFLVNFPLEAASPPRASSSMAAATTIPVPRVRLAPAWRGVVAVGLAGLVAGVGYVVWLQGARPAATASWPSLPGQPAPTPGGAPVPAEPAELVAPSTPAALSAAVPDEPQAPAAFDDAPGGESAVGPAPPDEASAGNLARRSRAPSAAASADRPARRHRAPARTAALAKPERRADQPLPAANPADPFTPPALTPPPLSPPPVVPKPAGTSRARPRAGGLTTDDF